MPHRLVTAVIILFWLGMTGALIYYEVMPYWLTEEVQIVKAELTDEIASPLIGWEVYKKGERIGSAQSRIIRNEDRGYDFRATYHIEKLNVPGLGQLRRMENVYRVDEDGKLKALSVQFDLSSPKAEAAAAPPDLKFEVKGEVENKLLDAKLLQNGQEVLSIGKIDMSEQGSIVNSMLLLNRVRGLHDGKTWQIRLFDPLSHIKSKFIPALLVKSATVSMLIARVSTDRLLWNKKEEECYKIEYYEPGKEPTANTWVRKHDGLVLQQEANRDSFELVLKRGPN